MKRLKSFTSLPISQNQLSSYLGVSPTLLSMTQTGRHGIRELNNEAFNKRAMLFNAFEEAKKITRPGVSFTTMQRNSSNRSGQYAKILESKAAFAQAYISILKQKLEAMIRQTQQDKHWLNTLDQLLAKLPETKESRKDRVWLEYQQTLAIKRLRKNGKVEQVKLETLMEMQKANARIYRDMQHKLLKG